MSLTKKFILFFLVILFPIAISPNFDSFNWAWLGLVGLFIAIILIFEKVETSRIKRSLNWKIKSSSKLIHMVKFSLFFGLPISAIIYVLIYNKAELLTTVLFILIPLLIVFGWIGSNDYDKCQKIYLNEKYDTEL